MRLIFSAATILLMLGVARADLAPPPLAPPPNKVPGLPSEVVPAKNDVAATLIAHAEAGREDLKAIIDSVKAPAVQPKEGAVTPHAQLPPNPCKSQMTAALRLCVQWLRNSTVRMEASTLDLMRARLIETRDDLRTLGRAMRDAIEEQKGFARGEPPPARPIPRNPCQGWNVSFWIECATRVDAALAGNLPDEASAAEIIRARDRLTLTLDTMMGRKVMDERHIRQAIGGQAKLEQAVAGATTRAEAAQRALAKTIKTAAKRGA